jgi:hypothetical protein
VSAWVSNIFLNFYLVKNHKIANNSTTTKARKKLSTDLESLESQKCFDVCLTIIKNRQILLDKISHRFLLTAKLCTGRKIPHYFQLVLAPMHQRRYPWRHLV